MREYDPTWGVPSPEPEVRHDGDFTEEALAQSMAQARGSFSQIGVTAAAEICAGLWGRGFMSARPEPLNGRTASLTPAVLEQIGRSLVRRGEQVFDIQIGRNGLRLAPAESWDVTGGPDPESWDYLLSLTGPTKVRTARRVANAVVHCRYAPESGRPWRGRSPLSLCSLSAALVAETESSLRAEASGPNAKLLPVPSTRGVGELAAGISTAAGRALLVPTTESGWGGSADRPARDWRPSRLGMDPPQSAVTLLEQSVEQLVAACGVPNELLQRTDGTSLREAWRQFLFGTLAPVARMVQAELRDKLEEPALVLTFDELRASDLAGRARAFQSMVGAGMEPARAASLAGLMEEE